MFLHDERADARIDAVAVTPDEGPQEASELGRVSRAWGARCVPLVYDPFLFLGELRGMRRLRADVVGQARGRVLELGAGTGLNLKHYKSVELVVLTEPDPAMARRLQRRLRKSVVPGEIVSASAEDLPFDAGSFDTVVTTMVLCTVANPLAALQEIRRVLAPGGRLLFIEHVRADPGSWLEGWQNRLYGPWRAFAYGCRCNQDTLAFFDVAGLHPEQTGTARWRGMPSLVRPLVFGEALPA